MPHLVIDYETFLPRLVAALRNAWREVRAQRPGENFYLFGIQTDSDITDFNPLCNTEEQYLADGGSPALSLEKWASNGSSPIYWAGRRHTQELGREVNKYVFEDHSQEPESAFLDRKRWLLFVFELALTQLDKEGFFGTGAARDRVMLIIEFTDADDAEWEHALKVIKRINPPGSTEVFFDLLQRAQPS